MGAVFLFPPGAVRFHRAKAIYSVEGSIGRPREGEPLGVSRARPRQGTRFSGKGRPIRPSRATHSLPPVVYRLGRQRRWTQQEPDEHETGQGKGGTHGIASGGSPATWDSPSGRRSSSPGARRTPTPERPGDALAPLGAETATRLRVATPIRRRLLPPTRRSSPHPTPLTLHQRFQIQDLGPDRLFLSSSTLNLVDEDPFQSIRQSGTRTVRTSKKSGRLIPGTSE